MITPNTLANIFQAITQAHRGIASFDFGDPMIQMNRSATDSFPRLLLDTTMPQRFESTAAPLRSTTTFRYVLADRYDESNARQSEVVILGRMQEINEEILRLLTYQIPASGNYFFLCKGTTPFTHTGLDHVAGLVVECELTQGSKNCENQFDPIDLRSIIQSPNPFTGPNPGYPQ